MNLLDVRNFCICLFLSALVFLLQQDRKMANTFLNIFRNSILLAVVLLQISFITVECCGEISNARGNITLDFIVRAGSPIRIQCSLYSTEIEVDHSTYNVSSENMLIKFRGTFLQDTYNIDERTIEYYKPRATVHDQGPYFCYIKIRDVERKLFVCSTTVAVIPRRRRKHEAPFSSA